jgi:hypothetical protein
LVGKCFGKANHVPKIRSREPLPEFLGQLSTQCKDNFLTIASSLVVKHFLKNSLAYAPVKDNETGVEGGGNLLASITNKLPEVTQQFGIKTSFGTRSDCASMPLFGHQPSTLSFAIRPAAAFVPGPRF